jgi:hypothetical protein
MVSQRETLKHVRGRSAFLLKTFGPDRVKCVYPECKDVVDQTELGDDTLCCYHRMLIDFWFYEKDGWKYAPDARDMQTGEIVRQPEADPDKATYRARWYKWANDLGQKERDRIVSYMAQSGCNWAL